MLNHVEDFVYLGGLISSIGSSQPDVRRRIGLACDAVRRLAKIWKSKAISKAAKVQVYETMVLSILFYNSETWTLTAETNRQLRVFEMGYLRRIVDDTRRDHIKNVDIRARTSIANISETRPDIKKSERYVTSTDSSRVQPNKSGELLSTIHKVVHVSLDPPKSTFSTDYISAPSGCWPLKFLRARV